MMTATMLLSAAVLATDVSAQHIRLEIDPATHRAVVTSTIRLAGEGAVTFRLNRGIEQPSFRLDGTAIGAVPADPNDEYARYRVDVPAGDHELKVEYTAVFEEDVASGERPNQIHNFAVDAHVGESGIFLSDGAAWHPQPLGADGRPMLHEIAVDIAPIDGWALVASGEPMAHLRDLRDPVWSWRTPRPVDGMAVVGNRHTIHGGVVDTPFGPVEVVMHVPEAHAGLAPMFIEAAGTYLHQYTPLLGAFPFKRFTIVENFFSSGFAFPGFTVLGPRVVAMAPRSLAPGYIDHELMHNWWGNGVYVDPDDGNWCEALTTFCSNYYRRVLDDGPEAGREFRRGILMKLSTDAEGLDNGPLGAFGSADPSGGGPDRFVGYDKGAFVFFMLGDVIDGIATDGEQTIWTCLRRFAEEHLGRRASWADLQKAFEAAAPAHGSGWLDGFFDLWVRTHTVPRTLPSDDMADAPRAFAAQFAASPYQQMRIVTAEDGTWFEIDPDFRIYRVLPPDQIIPTIAGTMGKGGMRAEAGLERPEISAYLGYAEHREDGENILLIGAPAVMAHAAVLSRADNTIAVEEGAFTLDGTTYDAPDQAVLHTMHHPERPGRFITVFHANGEAGWSRLRLIGFYSRDTTIIWQGNEVIERRTWEPDRRITIATP